MKQLITDLKTELGKLSATELPAYESLKITAQLVDRLDNAEKAIFNMKELLILAVCLKTCIEADASHKMMIEIIKNSGIPAPSGFDRIKSPLEGYPKEQLTELSSKLSLFVNFLEVEELTK